MGAIVGMGSAGGLLDVLLRPCCSPPQRLQSHVPVITESDCETETAQSRQPASQQKRMPFDSDDPERPSQTSPVSQPRTWMVLGACT